MRFPSAWCLVLTTFSYLSLEAWAWPTRHEKPPVCIIGAGPAGLATASKLEAKGIRAVMFEKQAEVGGKSQAWYDEAGIFHPLGAAFFSNGSYPETLKVLNQTNVTASEFALSGTRTMYAFNYTTGATQPVANLAQGALGILAAEIPLYTMLWNKVFAPIGVPNYKNGVPEELTVSGADWFRANNLTLLPRLLVNPLALYGYGDINVVPALYVLRYFTPDILAAFVGQRNAYYIDFHKVFVQWAEKIACKTPINLSHEVRCVDRSGNNPVLKYTKPHGNFYKWGSQKCSEVVFAFPPTIENLERTGLDLTEDEQDLFSGVLTHNYFSSAVKFNLPYNASYIAQSANSTVPPPNVGEPVAVLRLSRDSDVVTSWSWGPDREFMSEKYARNLLQTTLSKINRDPGNPTAQAEPLCSDDIKAFRKWDYFPHFDTEPLRNGSYAKLNKIQGQKKSFWASGLSGMEIVEWAIRGGQDVVDSYF